MTEIIPWILGQLVLAASVWGAIRADIKGIHERCSRLEKSLDDAHARIDRVLEHKQTARATR